MGKQKYYVVWSGRQTGIFTTWDECKQQVHGVKGAKYKSYNTKQLAEEAFRTGKGLEKKQHTKKEMNQTNSVYIKESISVDAACSGNPGDMEYRGVWTKDGREIFHYGPAPNGTNNIGEFLAIVHALALLEKENSNLPIYTDSLIAIGWVRKEQVNTTVERNESTKEVWNMLDRALKWLRNNTYENKLIKWETHLWGEIKADFGRK